MPDASSDDPFAELFGKLPDPRSRALRSSDEDADSGSSGGATTPTATSSVNTTGAPLSRRAAREAAQHPTGTIASETTDDAATATVTPTPATVTPTPATAPPTAPPAPTMPAAQAVQAARATQPAQAAQAARTVEPAAQLSSPVGQSPVPRPAATADVGTDTAPWIFAAADDAPPAPYGRGGSEAARSAAADTPNANGPGSTIESLFSGHGTTDDFGHLPPPKDKHRRRIGGWIALGVVLLFIGGIVAGGLWVWNTYENQIREVMGWEEPKDYADGEANGEAFVTVDEGDSGSPISQSLYDAGITKTPSAFYDYLIETQQNPPFVPGVFKLQKQMTSEAALAALLDPANKMENTAQLREGLTVDKSLEILAEATGLPVEDFEAAVKDPSAYGVAADSLEGWLFPATYTFDPDVTVPQVIQTLVDRTVKSLDDAGVPADDRQRILTIASIIQREARFSDDFYKVSRVIENRLDPGNQETFGKLQMDSTAQYGYGENHDGTASSSAEALADDNPWNTYFHTGLPIGPIANPGDLAIDAAMHPADGPWLYFVTVNLDTGETVFTSNLADHNRATDQWIAWCQDHPDSGC